MNHFIKEGKTNWIYILIIFIIASAIGGGFLVLSQNTGDRKDNLGEGLFYAKPSNKIKLFYYNETKDRELSKDGNLACSQNAILPVEREIIANATPIEDAVNLLIKGKLTPEEKAAGFSTEFPNPDFNLLELKLDEDKVMTASFTEVPGFTTGGACRTDLLAMQIVKTIFQFPGINQVSFYPPSLFQP